MQLFVKKSISQDVELFQITCVICVILYTFLPIQVLSVCLKMLEYIVHFAGISLNEPLGNLCKKRLFLFE